MEKTCDHRSRPFCAPARTETRGDQRETRRLEETRERPEETRERPGDQRRPERDQRKTRRLEETRGTRGDSKLTMVRSLRSVSLLLLSLWTHMVSLSPFYYQDLLHGHREVEVNPQLRMDASQPVVRGQAGEEAVLPCRFWFEPSLSFPKRVRIKWSKVSLSREQQSDVLVAIGDRNRSYHQYTGRVQLLQRSEGDASLLIAPLQLNDTGLYRCEVVGGLEDQSTSVYLQLQGVVFPYQHPRGRYHLSFAGAHEACAEQESSVASFSQLFDSWRAGLHWCNAGWLSDGSVQYPITRPRDNCGGPGVAPGVRSYGKRHLQQQQYDVFCFTSAITGHVFYQQPGRRMPLWEARQACVQQGALMAKVGQMYSAWKFQGLDHCEAGWLHDGSVRYAITKPRANCGPPEPGIRSFGFPPPQLKYGVYCYKEGPL